MITSFLYPSYCLLCKRLITYYDALCGDCFKKLPKVVSSVELIAPTMYMTIHAVTPYRGVIAHLVQAKEYRDQKSAQQLGKVVAQYAQEYLAAYDVIIPVPLHWARFISRGYNQTTIMAKQLQRAGFGQYNQPFMRRRKTMPQRVLSGSERKSNVKNAFGVKLYWSERRMRALLENKRILLIDDVYTSGSTARELAKAACRYSPSCIDILVACKVV